MRDEAVAPVVAAMLILAVIVTAFSAWNAIVIPSMKEQAEMVHLQGVEESFARFSSDVDAAASMKRDMKLSVHMPLGGGDTVVNSLKSGGTLRALTEDDGYMEVGITYAGGTTETALFRLANYSYRPVGNFWQDQGYDWSYGYINVTKGSITTPLEYADMNSIPFDLAGSLIGFEPVHSGADPARCSGMVVMAVNVTADPGHSSASGNGIGTLALNSSMQSRQFAKVTNIRISARSGTPAGFRAALWNYTDSKGFDVSRQCTNVIVQNGTPNIIDLQFEASPEVTVIRKITAIGIRAG
ncbi:hypothetical protein [Methanoregula sp.]|uniref:hypothetical protein n=1 Tax=Methanoregula sp. TaxID=2052170 RepID=UPI0035644EBC